MTYSTFIHSGIVNPAKPKISNESATDSQDTVTFDVPLLIRILELAREDLKSDADLHNVVEKILSLKNKGVLTMADYESIVAKDESGDSAELESILKLAGI